MAKRPVKMSGNCHQCAALSRPTMDWGYEELDEMSGINDLDIDNLPPSETLSQQQPHSSQRQQHQLNENGSDEENRSPSKGRAPTRQQQQQPQQQSRMRSRSWERMHHYHLECSESIRDSDDSTEMTQQHCKKTIMNVDVQGFNDEQNQNSNPVE
ncbi:hypothetical protein ACJJTC_017477 [Scirpophaga incertulas]